jgi:hypothetical protein
MDLKTYNYIHVVEPYKIKLVFYMQDITEYLTWNKPQSNALKNLCFVAGIESGNRTFNKTNRSCSASCVR